MDLSFTTRCLVQTRPRGTAYLESTSLCLITAQSESGFYDRFTGGWVKLIKQAVAHALQATSSTCIFVEAVDPNKEPIVGA